MKFVVLIESKPTQVEIVRDGTRYRLTIENKSFSVDAIYPDQHAISLIVDGKSYELGLEKRDQNYCIHFSNGTVDLELFDARKYKAAEFEKKSSPSGPLKITAPMPGKVIKVAVTENAEVSEGDPLLIIEAMKMQNELKAPRAGRIHQIHAKAGEAVSPQQTLMILE